MYDHSLFLRTVSQFAGRLLRPYDVDAMLAETITNVTEMLDLAGAGLVLAEEARLRTAVGVPGSLTELEEVQTTHRQGPCVEAFESGTVVALADLGEREEQWPEYCTAARGLGLTAVAGIPLALAGETVGAVDLYARGPRAWPPEDLEVAGVLADMMTAYLVNASTLRQHEQLADQLQQALDSRTVIEQAKGIVASRCHVPVDAAFDRIRAHARRQHVTVRAVAEAVVNLDLQV